MGLEWNSHGGNSDGVRGEALCSTNVPIKDAGKQPRFADLAKNCAVLVNSNRLTTKFFTTRPPGLENPRTPILPERPFS